MRTVTAPGRGSAGARTGGARSLLAAALPLLAVGSLAACGGADDRFGTPDRVHVPPESVVASFGELDDSTGVEVLSYVYGAALSESGRYVAVADRAPPHLRLLDRRTDSARSLAPEGEGPGELRTAWSVEFLGDSVLLALAEDLRIERYGVRGEWRGGHRLGGTGLLVSSITAGCGKEVYAYGHPAEYRHLDTVPWVHRLTLDEEASATPRLEIPGTDFRFGWGGLEGFDGTDAGVLLWDKGRSPQVGFWLPCGGDSHRAFDHRAAREIEMETVLETREGPSGTALTLPDTMFAGAAARDSTQIWARRALRPDDGLRVTSFRVVTGGEGREVELRGRWSLHDAHPEGLLLETPDPYPSVKVVDWSWFEEQLTPVACGSWEGESGSASFRCCREASVCSPPSGRVHFRSAVELGERFTASVKTFWRSSCARHGGTEVEIEGLRATVSPRLLVPPTGS